MKEGPQHPDPLASWTDQVLKQLPPRPAPSSLIPLVLAAVARRRALPWYRQPWFSWPGPVRLLTAVAASLVLGLGIWLVLPHAEVVSLASAKQAAAQFETVREVHTTADILKSLGSALLLVLKSLNSWVLAGILGAFALLWSTTVGLGTVCWRLTSGPR